MNKAKNTIKAVISDLNFKKDKTLAYSFCSVLIGLISGAIIICFSPTTLKAETADLFVSFFTDFTDKNKLEIFSGLALEGLIYFGALFVAGSNIFGKEMTLFITALKASGITAIISVLYSDYTLKGLEYTLLVFLPGKVILFFAMLFMTKFCFEFARDLRKGKGNIKETKSITNVYIAKSLIALLFMLISWLIDFFTIIIFSSLFDFNKQ